MTISQLIHSLHKSLEAVGDVPVYAKDEKNTEQDGESEISGLVFYAEEEGVSVCCGAKMHHDSDICPDCREHTDTEQVLPDRIFLKQ